MRSYIEVAALVIAVLFVETAGADAQEQVPPPNPSLGRLPNRSYFPVGNVSCTTKEVVGIQLPS